MSTLVRLESVGFASDSTQILSDVSMAVGRGSIVAIVGANGAGKTTLLDAISGAVQPTSGRVVVDRSGGDGARWGRVFQGSPMPATLTVAETARLVTNSKHEAVQLLSRFGLLRHQSSFVSELSTGMRRILDLACATAASPQGLLLDEPASGLAQAEIEHLARLIRSWRDSTGGAVIIVEHDLSLVRMLADEVLVMDAGSIVARGAPDEALNRDPAARKRIATSDDPEFRRALERVGDLGIEDQRLIKRSLSTWTLLRLGLREFAAGLGSVLILGVLNRVMKVELGIGLGVVAAVLASYNLAAPIGIAIGHRSDTRPVGGRRRLPYILAGAAITGITLAAAPHVAGFLGRGITPLSVTAATALFIAMGVGMYSAGSVFFALLADLAPPEDRGHAASIVYLELLAGVLVGVFMVGVIVDDRAGGLTTLFAVAGLLVFALTALAVWGHEDRLPKGQSPLEVEDRIELRKAVRTIARMSQARLFFAFMVSATLFLFLHQAVLEPYGGDVLGLTIRQTSAFNAVSTIGTIAGMIFAARPFATRLGYRKVATIGLTISSGSLVALAVAAAARAEPPTWLAIAALGLGTGIFTVAALALMMGMSAPKRAALFMGLWTMAHALANGAATAGGGAVFEAVRSILSSESAGYAAVFAIEGMGLAGCMLLLRRVRPEQFDREVEELEAA